jgi:hypothetical protein
LELFEHDMARTEELVHPNIARVLSFGNDGDTYFVTSEFVDGETLRNVIDHLRPERLDSSEVDVILGAIGDALAYAHDRGVVHGDVRLENVVVTSGHDFKLVNLASASLMRRAPFAARPSDDTRDFAALAYELYAGEPLGHGKPAARFKGLPKRRRRAIEAVLREKPGPGQLDVRDFLFKLGLPAQGPTNDLGADRLPWVPLPLRRPIWKLAIPGAGAAALAFVLYGNADRVGDLSRLGGSMAAEITAGIEQSLERRGSAEDNAETEPVRERPLQAFASRGLDAAISRNDRPLESRSGTAQNPVQARSAPETSDERSTIAPASSEPSARLESDARGATELDAIVLSLSAGAMTAEEGETAVAVEVVRSGDMQAAVEFAWWTRDGTAEAGDDYADFGRRVETLGPGEETRTFYVPITSDDLPEPAETFFVHIGPRQDDAQLGNISHVEITLIDDD